MVMNRLSQTKLTILFIVSGIVCYFATIYALMIAKSNPAESISTEIAIICFIYGLAFLPALLVNILSCFLYAQLPPKRVYPWDIFQFLWYLNGVLFMFTATPSRRDLLMVPPWVILLIITIFIFIVRNVLQIKHKA